jgi:hypothetical protein
VPFNWTEISPIPSANPRSKVRDCSANPDISFYACVYQTWCIRIILAVMEV